MDKKCKNSLSDFLPAPSAMLEGTETALLLTWEVNANFSSCGKTSETRYASFANRMDSFQIMSSL